jgi:hypothetical protein
MTAEEEVAVMRELVKTLIKHLNTSIDKHPDSALNVPALYTRANPRASWEDNLDSPGACSLQLSQKRALPNQCQIAAKDCTLFTLCIH